MAKDRKPKLKQDIMRKAIKAKIMNIATTYAEVKKKQPEDFPKVVQSEGQDKIYFIDNENRLTAFENLDQQTTNTYIR